MINARAYRVMESSSESSCNGPIPLFLAWRFGANEVTSEESNLIHATRIHERSRYKISKWSFQLQQEALKRDDTSNASNTSTPSPAARRSLSNQAISLLNSNSVGSLWTVQLTTLKQAGTHFEAVECLRRIRILLGEVDAADRIKYCRADYEAAVKVIRKNRTLWSSDLFKEVVAVTVQYFNANHFQRLPLSAFIEILTFIPLDELPPLFLVSEEWHDVCSSNEMWSTLYRRKFLLNNPGRLPSPKESMVFAFQQRLSDPQVGDKVEVAWRGKFRLETAEVYQGLAWWVAEIVDKHPAQGRYKIRYPGWDSRWDEWVPRARLRWKVSPNVLVSIQVGDVVELWCCGASVPGAWLEAKVKRVRNGRYCLGRILASGYLWVERERIRLARRPCDAFDPPGETDLGGGSSRSLLGGLVSGMSQRFQGLLGGGGGAGAGADMEPGSSCTVM